eukprot:CCRYP_014819-RA/>CCRYP_014819-RA protein AED:0.07 eAED:0.07 QI:717/0/1/1/1/1/2/221/72
MHDAECIGATANPLALEPKNIGTQVHFLQQDFPTFKGQNLITLVVFDHPSDHHTTSQWKEGMTVFLSAGTTI